MFSLAAILGASAKLATDPILIFICIVSGSILNNLWKAIAVSFSISFLLYALLANATGGEVGLFLLIAHLISVSVVSSISFFIVGLLKKKKKNDRVEADVHVKDDLNAENDCIEGIVPKQEQLERKKYVISTYGYNFGKPSNGGYKVIHWYFNEGDYINSGENLVDVEGEDWVSTLVSEHSGVLASIYIKENRRFKPNADIGEIRG